MMAYGVNEVALGNYMRIKSYEGINAAIRSAWHECIIPKQDYIEYVFNAVLFKNTKYRFRFDRTNIETLKEDMFRKLEMGNFLLNLTYTPEQINNRFNLNMPKNPWSDAAFIKNDRISVLSKDDLDRLNPLAKLSDTGTSDEQVLDNDNEEETDDKNIFVKTEENISS